MSKKLEGKIALVTGGSSGIAPRVQVVVIPDATHFVHVDPAERGKKELLDTIAAFLKN